MNLGWEWDDFSPSQQAQFEPSFCLSLSISFFPSPTPSLSLSLLLYLCLYLCLPLSLLLYLCLPLSLLYLCLPLSAALCFLSITGRTDKKLKRPSGTCSLEVLSLCLSPPPLSLSLSFGHRDLLNLSRTRLLGLFAPSSSFAKTCQK